MSLLIICDSHVLLGYLKTASYNIELSISVGGLPLSLPSQLISGGNNLIFSESTVIIINSHSFIKVPLYQHNCHLQFLPKFSSKKQNIKSDDRTTSVIYELPSQLIQPLLFNTYNIRVFKYLNLNLD